MERLLELAEAHRDWRMPGYTHLQRAQPVYLGHHLLAYFWMLERDATASPSPRRSTMAMPLGSGALAGLNWELDRDATAASSASPGRRRTRSTRSPTATSRSTTCPRRPSARPTSRGSAPRS